ncbi:hypothetical protein TWF694_009264 [Orbilia ellipsospora]|uniref:F-box domain-containing protein n=1 Tax=Orbilia ellipsospora TaxID=2528407 RepID=A0AAV9XED8_9PEZI
MHRSNSTDKADRKNTEPRSKIITMGFIPEVLEDIFLHVPALELILSCRLVCKAWRDLIDAESPALKEYTASGIRREDSPIENGESTIFTPMAIHFYSMLWKKLAKALVVYIERKPPRKSVVDHLMRKQTWEVEQEDPEYEGSLAAGGSLHTLLYRGLVALAIMPVWLPAKVIKTYTVDAVRDHRKAKTMAERQETVKEIFAQFDAPAKNIQLCRKDLKKTTGVVLEFDEVPDGSRRGGLGRHSELNVSSVTNDTGVPEAAWNIMVYMAGVAYDANFSYKNGTEPAYKTWALQFEQRASGEEGWNVVKEEMEFETHGAFKTSVGETNVSFVKRK